MRLKRGRARLFVVEANVLVYTLWSEWAQCNVCGKASGERRRTGSSVRHPGPAWYQYACPISNLYSPKSHGRNIEKNTAKRYLHTKKYMKKSIQGPQPESGQVPTYYIFVTIIHKIHTISLNSCPCRTSESSFTASATNMLHSLFSDTLVLHTQNTSAICNY